MQRSAPDFIANRLDVKADTIHIFAEELEYYKKPDQDLAVTADTSVILLTNFGMVEGNIETFSAQSQNKNPGQLFSEELFKTRNNLWSQTPEESVITNNSGIIVVNHAKVTPFQNPQIALNYEILFLFSDQITGFTFGSKP